MSLLERVLKRIDVIMANPKSAVIATNSATSLFFLWLLARRNGGVKKSLLGLVFGAVKAIPGAAGMIEKEKSDLIKKMETSILKESAGEAAIVTLPAAGMSKDDVLGSLQRMANFDVQKWSSGKVSGTVYHGGDDITDVVSTAFRLFTWANPLHPDVFPSVRKMEAEVVRMTVNLFNGDEKACGTMTSGGTESILMACKAYRDYARQTRGITEPEMVVPTTVHAAFDKAAHYFNIKLVHVPVDPKTFCAVPSAMAAAINGNTIMLVGSAPCFPQGTVDPITELAAIAKARGLPMHVDCCLGSFLIPYAKKLGYPIPDFDFSVDGVTSISCDTHKFGFAPKGTSTILYSEPKWRQFQYFVATDWTGGIYASPSIAGSRPGALIAGAWATLVHVGDDGYRKCAEHIMDAATAVAAGVRDIPEICLYGDPKVSVVAFGPRPDSSLNIFNVGDAMTARGWNLNVLQFPGCVHICITHANAAAAKEHFCADLRDAVEDVMTAPKGKFKDGTGAMYGMAESIPDRSIVEDLASGFLDVLYKT